MDRQRTVTTHGALLVVGTLLPALLLRGAPSGPPAQDRPAEPDGPPRILVLGSPHMAQADREWKTEQVQEVVDAMTRFRPGLVAVEHLPPGWPKGRGRDYRPGFDLGAFAERWGMELSGASDDAPAEGEPCRRARRLFLRRDLANAAYVWLAEGVECEAESRPEIAEWLHHWRQHEMVRIAFPVARDRDLEGVVSIDYQGEDARWFLDREYLEEVQEKGDARERAEADSVEAEIMDFRQRAARRERGAGLIRILRYHNSTKWIEAQRRMYEEVLPGLSYREAGARQTANYWLRNRRMFDRLEEAAAARNARRILVVVGAGHKYFLDELARERGYRWVDPLEYLGREAHPVSRAND